MESVVKQIENKIISRKRGVFVFPSDFASLGTPESMIYGESLPFDKLIKQVKELNRQINQI